MTNNFMLKKKLLSICTVFQQKIESLLNYFADTQKLYSPNAFSAMITSYSIKIHTYHQPIFRILNKNRKMTPPSTTKDMDPQI
jgi:hypothetical protein